MDGAFVIVVDGGVFVWGAAERKHFFDDLRQGGGIGAGGSRTGNGAERTHGALQALRFFSRQERGGVIDHDNGAAAENHIAFLGEVKRHDGNIFRVDVEPDVEFGPVGKRKYANAFAFVETGVENIPQLWALVFRVPLAQHIAERIHSLLGP